MLKKEGYTPIPVSIPWKQTTISENTEYFLKKYKKIDTKKKYILGFSYGAIIALLASTKVKTSGLILCSLSPYFKEDYQGFPNLPYAALAKQVKAKQTLMLYGAKETKSLIKRVSATFRYIPSAEKYLIQIRKTEHDIGNIRYLQTLTLATKELL